VIVELGAFALILALVLAVLTTALATAGLTAAACAGGDRRSRLPPAHPHCLI